MSAQITSLESQFPAIIAGPDLWSLFSGHSTSDGWFLDDLHPSVTTGCDALQSASANSLLASVYQANSSARQTTARSVATWKFDPAALHAAIGAAQVDAVNTERRSLQSDPGRIR
jgi:hypothetical protein